MGKIEFEGSAVEHFYRRFGVDPKRFKGYSIFQNKGMSFISTPQVYSFWEVKTIRKGLEFGKIYGQEIKPDNDLIQIFGKKANRNYYEIKEYQLNKFLKGETIKIDSRSGISNGLDKIRGKKGKKDTDIISNVK
jgi:NOL1/NOP2/fmu family ribosome biogenesis protein